MNTLNKICTALTIIFAVSLVVLVAEILYVLWRRRRFQSRSLASGDVEFGDESFYPTPSKELLYFFCWKNCRTNRIEPAHHAETAADAPPLPAAVDDVDEMLKRHALYGPSRVLFTIKEEEREEMETEAELSSSADNGGKRKKKNIKTRSVSMEEVTMNMTAAVAVFEVDDSTPFSTPCASPPYYTPSPSPSRDRNAPTESGVVLDSGVSVDKMMPLVIPAG